MIFRSTSRLSLSSFFMIGLLMTGLFYFAISCQPQGPRVVKNPYDNINWQHIHQYVMNLHAHTIKSDGRGEPDHVIHMYAEAGYDILSLSDHDNYYTHRQGERDVEPTHETTWPWTRWISEEPSRIWKNHNGIESSAFYPGLGNRGMLAIRSNELTTHPHLLGSFTHCGFPDRNQTEEERMDCIEEQDGLGYWAHPTDYIPGGRWEDRLFDTDFEQAISYFSRYLLQHDFMIGVEMQLENRLEREIQLLDSLLVRYYKDHDIYIMGADDSHSTRVSDSATMTLVFAEELTEESIRFALQNGHKIVGSRTERLPVFHTIEVRERERTIHVELSNYDSVTWFKNGEAYQQGNTLDFSNISESTVRFEVASGGQTFYSQAFYIE